MDPTMTCSCVLIAAVVDSAWLLAAVGIAATVPVRTVRTMIVVMVDVGDFATHASATNADFLRTRPSSLYYDRNSTTTTTTTTSSPSRL